jgi:uncharacterized protein (TIGR03032 family)
MKTGSESSTNSSSTQIEVAFTTSAGFSSFLAGNRISIVVSTYQTGNIFFFGPEKDDHLAVCPIKLLRPMGLYLSGQSLFVGGKYQIWRFNNILPPGVIHEGADRLFVPQVSWTIADMDAHDIVIEKGGRLVFVNTLYSCLATVSQEHSFIPLWRPPPIKELQPQDRCHLNGVALRDGRVAYASAFSTTDTLQGWRESKKGGGVIWDVRRNLTVLEKMTMPHSPRWNDQRLWCLESGSGRFGWVDTIKKVFHSVIDLPGYLRGLTFHGDFAFIGSSIPRDNSGIKHVELEDKLATKGESQACGIFIVNWRTGKLAHFVRITGGVQEVYDVAVLPETFRPQARAIDDERVETLLNIGPEEASGGIKTPKRDDMM